MHMEVKGGSLWRRVSSGEGRTANSHYFVMDWVSVWQDIAIGLLLAGAMATWVPASFWNTFFATAHPTLALLWGPIVGPLVAIISFVCSVGNVPLAAVAIEWLFRVAHLVPSVRHARVVEASITLNYTTVLNAVFLGLGALMVYRFMRTGGPGMLRMMHSPAASGPTTASSLLDQHQHH